MISGRIEDVTISAHWGNAMLVVWQSVALALVAAWLLHRGLRGTRVGDEPRCRKCDYRLDGLTSQQCPECGTTISDKTVVHGTRVVRRRYVVAAALMVFLWVPVQDILWVLPRSEILYYVPNGICLQLAKHDNLGAARELTRRINHRELDRSASDRAFSLASSKIRKQPIDPVWHDLLYTLGTHRLLTPAQQTALCPFAPRLTATYRPKLRQGDPLVVYYDAPDEQPQTAVRWSVDDVWVDRQPEGREKSILACLNRVPVPYRFLSRTYGIADLETVDWKPGIRNIEVAVSTGGLSVVPLIPEKSFLGFAVEILPTDAPPIVGWSTHDLDAQELQSSFDVWIGSIHFHPEYGSIISVTVQLKEILDIAVAWDVVVEVEGEEHGVLKPAPMMERMDARVLPHWNCGEKGTWQSYKQINVENANEVYVVLCSSPRVALYHPDIQEIWKGELRFGPFPWSPRSAFQHGLSNVNP